MTNQFDRLLHPTVSLASNSILESFGPLVQIVADCLQARGGQSTLSQVVNTIESNSRPKVRSGERKHIIKANQLRPMSSVGGPSVSSIRASLLVLVQHSIVSVTATKKMPPKNKTKSDGSMPPPKAKTTFLYEFHADRARLVPRYPRFVEYTKKAFDKALLGESAAALVEQLLLKGRMGTVDAIVATVDQLHQIRDMPRSQKYTYRQAVLESFRRLVGGGFIHMVQDLRSDFDEQETEFEDSQRPPPAKKPRLTKSTPKEQMVKSSTDDPAVVTLLHSGPYKNLPIKAVWKVNIQMFHDSVRAVALGWLVSERFAQKVQYAGAMVTAALKLAAHKQHAEQVHDYESRAMFSTESITRYLNKSVVQSLEKKHGGVVANLHKALVELTKLRNPQVLEGMEVADGEKEKAKFRVSIRRLTEYLHNRIIHQVIVDSHGEVAARVISILRVNGHLEAEAIAEAAMVPAKDTREVLHRLFKENFLSLFNVNQGKQHNPAHMIYLWSLNKTKIRESVTDTVCSCLLNLRLRRQHEVEVGKDWIERAKEAGATYENDNEADKLNYNRFCQGLERLDNAILQLDETMMVLKDF